MAEISKNARKRLRKQQIQEERKKKKTELCVLEANDEHKIETEVSDYCIKIREERQQKKQRVHADFEQLCQEGCTVCVDCSFDLELREKDKKSLAQQIILSYGKNKRSSRPVRFAVTSAQEWMIDHLKKLTVENWMGFDVFTESYLEKYSAESLVYLTADSENILTFDRTKVYIIGGMVDRNRMKGATLARALNQGIQTARLPISENIQLKSSTVLTINQVFEIIVAFQELEDWKKALIRVIPPRKLILDQTESQSPINNIQSKISADLQNPPSIHKNPVVLVIGGSCGIGLAWAQWFFQYTNAQIVLVSRSELKLREAIATMEPLDAQGEGEIKNSSNRVSYRACDVMLKPQLLSLRQWIKATYGRVDAVILSSGTFLWDDELDKIDSTKWTVSEYLMHSNFGCKLAALRSFTNLLRENPNQQIACLESITNPLEEALSRDQYHSLAIILGSQAGQPGFKESIEEKEGEGAADNESGYIASMARLHDWIENSRHEWENHGVKIHLLEPSLVSTDMAKQEFSRLGSAIDWNNIPSAQEYVSRTANEINITEFIKKWT